MNERDRADRSVIKLKVAHAPADRVEAAYNRALHNERRRGVSGDARTRLPFGPFLALAVWVAWLMQ
jgi:hypothetical protein